MSSLPSPICLKARYALVNVSPYPRTRKRRITLITRDTEHTSMTLHEQTLLNNPYLPLVSMYRSPNSFHLVTSPHGVGPISAGHKLIHPSISQSHQPMFQPTFPPFLQSVPSFHGCLFRTGSPRGQGEVSEGIPLGTVSEKTGSPSSPT